MFKQLLILLLVFNAINLNAQWKSMGSDDFPGVPGDMIFHVHALDEENVWGLLFKAATFAPTQTYFKTVDGGATITTHEIEVEDPSLTAFAIHAYDENTAWVAMTSEPCQCYGQVYKTVDGGATWEKQFVVNSEQSILGIYFWDENEGFAIGGNGTGATSDQSVFYRTFNGGETWQETTSPLIQPGESHFLGSGNSLYDVIGDQIFFGTRKGRIFKSSDRGMTWEVSLELENIRTISDVAFQDDLIGIAISAMSQNGPQLPNRAWKTEDGGLSWTLLDIPRTVPALSIEFIPETKGSFVITAGFANSRNMLVTRTSGEYWTEINSPKFIGMTFVSPTVAYGGSFIQEAGLAKLVSSFSNNHVNVKTIVGNRLEGFERSAPLKSNLYNPNGMEMDSEGNLYIANHYANNILKLSADGSELFNWAGTPGFPNDIDVDPLSDDTLDDPQDLAIDEDGNLYVADARNNQIKMISPTGEISIFAGTGEAGGVDGNAATATFNYPVALCFDSNGNLLVGEQYKIRKVAIDGTVTTVAGSGLFGDLNGTGIAAEFNFISSMDIDDADNLYVTDIANSKIRKIDPNGVVTTLAGDGAFGYLNGPGNIARFNGPEGIVVDKYNNIYVGDGMNGFIRKIDTLGNVTTVAGTLHNAYQSGPGNPGPQIQDGSGSSAVFSRCRALNVKPNGDLLATDWGADVVREIQFGLPSLPISAKKILDETQNISHIDYVDDFTFGANVTNTSVDVVENVELRVVVSLDGSPVIVRFVETDIIEIGETELMLIDESFTPESVGDYDVEYSFFVDGEKLFTIDDEIIVSDSVMGYDDYHPYLVASYDFITGWDNGFGMAYDISQPDTITGMELFVGLEEASVVQFEVYKINSLGILQSMYISDPITFDNGFFGMFYHEIPPIIVDEGKYLFGIKGLENTINVGIDNDHRSDQFWMIYNNSWGNVEEILNGYVELAAIIHPVLQSAPTIINTTEIDEVSIDIFPNPFATSITINQHQAEELTISLIDVSGKIMLEKFSNDEIIQLDNLEHLAAGAYMVRVKGEDFIKDVPVVKN